MPPFVINLRIDSEAVRFASQRASMPMRFALADLRRALRDVRARQESVRDEFRRVEKLMKDQKIPMWQLREELAFLGFVVGTKPWNGSKYWVRARFDGVDVLIVNR